MSSNKLKILIVAAEVAPFAKAGGLGDVIGSLPQELKKLDVDVRVVMPKYMCIKEGLLSDAKYQDFLEVSLAWRNQTASIHLLDKEVPIYFIENDYYFGRDLLYGYADDGERFAFFSKAAIEMLPVIGFRPDIVHLNDWHCGMSALLLRDYYSKMSYFSGMKSLFTIHNLQYQGNFPKETLDLLDLPQFYAAPELVECYGNISYMKAGLVYSDAISTVSKTYADEIQTGEYGYGLDGVLRKRSNVLSGILNGIDYNAYNPQTDTTIYKNFSIDSFELKRENKKMLQNELGLPESDAPIISLVTRLVSQKGLDILEHSLAELLSQDIQLVIVGTGEGRYEHLFKMMQAQYPEKVSANIRFDNVLAQKVYAGSDMFLMPSLFEPCGLGQIIAMRYGTVPIVRKTGGLKDTVTDYNSVLKEGNGFVFNDYDSGGILWAIKKAASIYNTDRQEWNSIALNGMKTDFSWCTSAKEYIKLYTNIKES